MSDVEDIGSLKDCYVTQPNGKRALSVNSGGYPLEVVQVANPAISKVPIDLYFSQSNGPATTLAADAVKNTRTLEVVDDTNFSVGDRAVVLSPFGAYAGEVLGVAAGVLSVAPLIPENFSAGLTVESRTIELNVDGSVTPQIFEAFLPPGLLANQLNVTRLLIEMLTSTAPALDEFGDIAGGLTYGLLLRGTPDPASGIPTVNNWNAKTNGELANLAFDLKPLGPVFGAGQEGFVWRYSWGGEDKHDSILPINLNDKVELVIQDNLTSLEKFRMIYAGNFQIPRAS